MIHPRLLDELRDRGLLLAADNTLPSVTLLIAGEPIRGSWWTHPKSHAIFAASTALARHPDAIAIPLISGKVTFVHRRLWPALLAVALARERWQTAKLPPAARALLKRVETAGEMEASGEPVRELERRLLAKSEQRHTDQGSHAKHIESWTRWASRAGVTPLSDVAVARQAIETAAASLRSEPGPAPKLPWSRTSRSA